MLSNCAFSPFFSFLPVLTEPSAANDFWGKTYLGWSGEAKMTQQLSILTGCSAGATVCRAFASLTYVLPHTTISNARNTGKFRRGAV